VTELPCVEQLPTVLCASRRWIGRKNVWDESKKKNKKPPYSPVDGSAIGATEKYADHWLTFDEALKGVVKYQLDGLGFVFKDGDGFIGLDFDDCRDPETGAIDPIVQNWLRWFPTFTEVSPSGTGIHIIGKAKLVKSLTAHPLDAARPEGPKIEIYDRDRYFAITGKGL